ncbi:MAG TPA: glycosyltransferase family 4 protein [Dokdonella sp.]
MSRSAPARVEPRAAARRVLMSADTVGGVWRYALELCRALIARGHEVALATMGRMPDRAQRREADAIRGLELYPSGYRLVWMDGAWGDVATAGEWLLALAADVRPDVVHLNDLGHGDLPWPAPVLIVGHSCVLSWWDAVHRAPAPPEWSRYAAHVRRGLGAADLVVAPTRAMLAELQRFYGPLRRTRVIANGRSRPQAPACAREPMVLSAGRLWDEAKNVGALAAAAPRVPWPVRVAGPDRAPDGARIALANVELLGTLDAAALDGWLARAPIYALPARYEPFGLSVLEAAQSGCALVLGDVPSLRENWDGAAAFVAADDVDRLVVELNRLIGDDTRRARLGAAARRRAQRFTPAAMAAAYADAYTALDPRHRGADPQRRHAGVAP